MATRKKILLAENLETYLSGEQSSIDRVEFDLLCTANGQDALDLIEYQRPDLVLLELIMPELDGDACCRRVKDDPELAATPIVIVTAAEDPSGLQRCHDCGCDEVLLKPVNPDKILAAVHRHLDFPERRETRMEARLRVHYGQEAEQILTDYSVNISSGGLFLETVLPLPIDTPLHLEFHLPGHAQHIICAGRVAWVNLPDYPKKPGFPSGMGIQLLGLSLDAVHAIRDFLKDQELNGSW